LSYKMDISLSPIPASIAGGKTHYEDGAFFVALRRIKDVYELFLFHGFVKRFTTATMPNEIKPKLAMINSLKEFFMKKDGDFQELDMYISRLYLSKEQEEFKNIGWRVSPEMYVLILTQDEINKLQGVDV
jgi:hypothetical protein